MFALMKPLRGGDGATLRVTYGTPDDRTVRDEAGQALNCVVLHTTGLDVDAAGAHLGLTQFKVAHSHGTIVVSVPERLVRIVQLSLRHNPREFLFANRKGNPRTRATHSEWSADVLSRLLGERVTTTLLRHVSATSINWNEVETADLQQHVHEMATSTGMLLNNYRVSGAAMKRLWSPSRAEVTPAAKSPAKKRLRSPTRATVAAAAAKSPARLNSRTTLKPSR